MSLTTRAWAPTSNEKVESRRSPPAAARRPRVLLVDDEPEVLRALTRLLAPHASVTTAHSAAQAAILLDAFSYQAVITDYEMPGPNGLWLLERARERFPRMRRVMLTGSDNVEIAVQRAAGLVERLLAKPAERDEILRAIAPDPRDAD